MFPWIGGKPSSLIYGRKKILFWISILFSGFQAIEADLSPGTAYDKFGGIEKAWNHLYHNPMRLWRRNRIDVTSD